MRVKNISRPMGKHLLLREIPYVFCFESGKTRQTILQCNYYFINNTYTRIQFNQLWMLLPSVCGAEAIRCQLISTSVLSRLSPSGQAIPFPRGEPMENRTNN